MKNNSFSLFVRRPTWDGRICAFRLFCMATVLVSLFSGLGLAQDAPPANVTGSGTADFIPRWTGTTTLGNSNIFETVGGDVGIATTTPAARLDVKGTGDVRDTLTLFPKSTHPTLSVHGTAFAVSNTGTVTFVAGQTFPGTGTITGVTAGTDLTGGGTSGSVTLNLDTTKVPTLGASSNTFTGNLTVDGTTILNGIGNELVISVVNSRGEVVENNSSAQTLQLQNFAAASSSDFTEAQFNVNGTATFFTDTLGDTTATGTKHAVVPLRNGRMVDVTSMESPEVWFEDFGSGQLTGGITTVSIDASFSQIVTLSTGYHVFVTPKGDCKGLFVTNETTNGFEVRELSGGQSSVEFDYRIVAHRKGYEKVRLPIAKMPKLPVQTSAPPHAN
jgi:hypothetical protein